jgi:hypothetical protein
LNAVVSVSYANHTHDHRRKSSSLTGMGDVVTSNRRLAGGHLERPLYNPARGFELYCRRPLRNAYRTERRERQSFQHQHLRAGRRGFVLSYNLGQRRDITRVLASRNAGGFFIRALEKTTESRSQIQSRLLFLRRNELSRSLRSHQRRTKNAPKPGRNCENLSKRFGHPAETFFYWVTT